MEEFERVQRSRTLSMWLRHKPERGGLTLSKEGWAAVPAILEAFEKQGIPLSRVELEEVIRLDPKARYELQGDKLRARYGHSVELEEKPHPGTPPATLYHGTPRRYVANILEMGLRPMKRQFVHLSPDKKTAREVGMRRDQEPAILAIAAHQANEAGIQFYPRGKGIWMSDPIPAEFITVLDEPPPRQPARRTSLGTKQLRVQEAPGEARRRRPRGGFMKKPDKNT
jgi:putative RNA 2'-phosphotransferase